MKGSSYEIVEGQDDPSPKTVGNYFTISFLADIVTDENNEPVDDTFKTITTIVQNDNINASGSRDDTENIALPGGHSFGPAATPTTNTAGSKGGGSCSSNNKKGNCVIAGDGYVELYY
jgi:hypothetical protein